MLAPAVKFSETALVAVIFSETAPPGFAGVAALRTKYALPIPNAESTIRFTPGSKELAARKRQALPFLFLPLHLPLAACAGSRAFPPLLWIAPIVKFLAR